MEAKKNTQTKLRKVQKPNEKNNETIVGTCLSNFWI